MQVAVKDSFEFLEVPTSADVMTSNQHYKGRFTTVYKMQWVWSEYIILCMQLFDIWADNNL
mgnify:FL=1